MNSKVDCLRSHGQLVWGQQRVFLITVRWILGNGNFFVTNTKPLARPLSFPIGLLKNWRESTGRRKTGLRICGAPPRTRGRARKSQDPPHSAVRWCGAGILSGRSPGCERYARGKEFGEAGGGELKRILQPSYYAPRGLEGPYAS